MQYLQIQTFLGFHRDFFHSLKNILWGRLFLLVYLGTSFGNIQAASLNFLFSTSKPGFYTLVLDDSSGLRYRNLISETYLNSGSHEISWTPGTDTVRVDQSILGVRDDGVPKLKPGQYRVRGMLRDSVHLRYEFTPYNSGTPPWETIDGKGQWLADHSPPTGAAYIPSLKEILITSEVSESSAGVIWLDSTGKKTYEIAHLYDWKCASMVTVDVITGRVFGAINNGGIRVSELTNKIFKDVVKGSAGTVRGISARASLVVVSRRDNDSITLINADLKKVIGNIAISSPRGSAFDSHGRFLILAKDRLLRGTLDSAQLTVIDTLVQNLKEPLGLSIDSLGRIYISCWDTVNSVLVYDSNGTFIRNIGTPGPIVTGPYDRLHMQRPMGITIDAWGKLWVSEATYLPKRISVWDSSGTLEREFFGPTKYGGGGVLDPVDTTRFWYGEERGRGSMELTLDWASGTSKVSYIHLGGNPPNSTRYWKEKIFWTDEFNDYPTRAPKTLHMYTEKDNRPKLSVVVGYPNGDSILSVAPIMSKWNSKTPNDYLYAWSDLNQDGKIDADEVQFKKITGINVSSLSLSDDFSILLSSGKGAYRLAPPVLNSQGIPVYDLEQCVQVTNLKGEAVQMNNSMIVTMASTITGSSPTQKYWTYPSRWPEVHGSWQSKSPPSYPGEMIGVTKFVSGSMSPKGSDIGEVFAINGNMGNIYLMTWDGLFAATLFQDFRVASKPYSLPTTRGTGRGGWHMPNFERGLLLDNVSGGEEHFYPSLVQTKNGGIYCVGGHEHSSLIHVTGLETSRRISSALFKLDSTNIINGEKFELSFETDTLTKVGIKGRNFVTRPNVFQDFNALTIQNRLQYSLSVTILDLQGRKISVRQIQAGSSVAIPKSDLGKGLKIVHLHSLNYEKSHVIRLW